MAKLGTPGKEKQWPPTHSAPAANSPSERDGSTWLRIAAAKPTRPKMAQCLFMCLTNAHGPGSTFRGASRVSALISAPPRGFSCCTTGSRSQPPGSSGRGTSRGPAPRPARACQVFREVGVTWNGGELAPTGHHGLGSSISVPVPRHHGPPRSAVSVCEPWSATGPRGRAVLRGHHRCNVHPRVRLTGTDRPICLLFRYLRMLRKTRSFGSKPKQ
jgi:hypothetical protein